MAKYSMTIRWEAIKHHYRKGLCFSKEKGLYTRNISEGEEADDILYRPHGYYGYVKDNVNVLDLGLNILFDTNFGYSSASYMRAKLISGGNVILDFNIEKLRILNHCSVETITVPVYDWDYLFYRVMSLSKQTSSEQERHLIAYIKEIGIMLNQDVIEIKGTFEDNKSVKWEGDYLVALYTGRKIRDLLDGLKKVPPFGEKVTNLLLDISRRYVSKVVKLNPYADDPRIPQLSDDLLAVHEFMCQEKAGAEYVNLILGNSEIT